MSSDSPPWQKIDRAADAIMEVLRYSGLSSAQCPLLYEALYLLDQTLRDFERNVAIAEKGALTESGEFTAH